MKLFAYNLREFDEKPAFDQICKEFNAEYAYTTEYQNPDNVKLAKGYEAVSITPSDMSASMLEAFHQVGVRYVTTRSIGFDHIDLIHARELGMGVSHVNYAPDTVADYTVMLMLMCCRKICHILDRSFIQDFTLNGKIGKDLRDCTVGIIGTGRIGKTVIKRLTAFGCRIICYDPQPDMQLSGNAQYVSLDQLYRECDIITLHTPANADNYHMINRETLSRMKYGVILINTARGSLIDEEALITAVESGKIGHAALDVLEQEESFNHRNFMGKPIVNRNLAILRSFPNVIFTPHTAFYTQNVVYEMALKTFSTVSDMMNGVANPLILV